MQILVPIDYSELGKKALRTACSLHPDADIVVLHVIDFRSSDLGPGGWGESPSTWDDWLAESREHADELLQDAKAIAAEYDVDISTDTVVGEDASEIVEYAEDNDIDLIIMGSHGRSLPARLLLGDVSETVVRRAPVPVMVVRGQKQLGD
jgi:nucleotide-binding universal stress UspA family protein